MKKSLTKLVALSLITSASLYATNGDNLIGLGAKSRSMGGTDIAVSHGAESILSNGAMITSVEKTEITFGGFMFLPTMKTDLTATGILTGEGSQSAADFNGIPEVSIVRKMNDNLWVGIGMFGAAGMGVDYRDTQGGTGNLGMVTSLLLFKFAMPVAYKKSGFTASVVPVIGWSLLDINYAAPFTANFGAVGGGLAQTFSISGNLGISYDFGEVGIDGLTFGAIFNGPLKMSFSDVISHATEPFAVAGVFDKAFGDDLEQPAEYGVGFSYTKGPHTVGFDYKFVNWADAAGYGDFGWENGNVFAAGYRYETDKYAVRMGYNYGKSVVQNDPAGKTDKTAAGLNLLNVLGFPGTAEHHLTMGGTYKFTEMFSIDVGLVYQVESELEVDVGGLADVLAADALKDFVGKTIADTGASLARDAIKKGLTVTNTHQETSLSFQLVFDF